jgi:hypothetical protein
MSKRKSTDCFTYRDLAQHLPCFFDVPIVYLHRSSGLSVKGIIKARKIHGGGVMDTWPFVTIKQGINPVYSWESVMQERSRVMAETSNPHVLTMLQKAARKAEQVRLICNTPFERIRLRVGEEETRTAPRHSMCTQDLQFVLQHMIDLPLKTVEQLLRISLHTIFQIRANIGLSKWPYEQLCRGTYTYSMAEVADARRHVLSTLKEGSGPRMVLEDAAAVADTQTIHPKYTSSKYLRESSPPPHDEMQAPCDDTMPDMDMQSAVYEAQDETQPLFSMGKPVAPQPIVEEDTQDEAQPLFRMDEPAAPQPNDGDDDDFWGNNADLSPASRAYWDSLADLSSDAFT